MIRTIWNDPERFKKSYFPEELKGYYLAGDGAVRSADRAYFRITGRIDDVLNVSGHRMGTMEIESALVAKTDLVAEAAVVGRPDDLTGEAICAFVVLKRPRPTGEEAKKIATELRNWVAKEIGPIAKPKDIRFGDNLPKTRSGKIMRRLLRSIAKGEALAAELAHHGLEAHSVTDLEHAVRQSDIVSCVTTSTAPIVKGAWLKPGAHVDLAGAFKPTMRETDAEVVARSSVYVDTRDGALAEAGDLLQARDEGKFDFANVKGDLFDLCRGKVKGRSSADEITLFKSAGTAIEDLATAIMLYQKAR
jgi:hypothetical protein